MTGFLYSEQTRFYTFNYEFEDPNQHNAYKTETLGKDKYIFLKGEMMPFLPSIFKVSMSSVTVVCTLNS